MNAKETVSTLYEELRNGDPERLLELLHPEVEFEIAESLPYGDHHVVGAQNVIERVWGRLDEDWENLTATPAELLLCGKDTVVALGSYSGRCRATGREMKAAFAHVCTVENGRLRRLRQYTDTARWLAALDDGAITPP